MLERIKQLMEQKQLTSTQFADGIEVPRAVVSHILSGRNKPSLDVAIRILETHRDVRMEWLLLGEGEMLKKVATAGAAVAEQKPQPGKDTIAPEAVPAPTVPETPPLAAVAEKVQISEQPKKSKPAPPTASKTIERIIIFYDDKTFDTYSPV